jgi:hypothetical protein
MEAMVKIFLQVVRATVEGSEQTSTIIFVCGDTLTALWITDRSGSWEAAGVYMQMRSDGGRME